MDLDLSYNDLRKVAIIFRRPGIVLNSCSLSTNGFLQVDVRVDLAAFVDIAAKLGRPVPISITLELNLNLLDARTVSVGLESLNLDKSELPIMIRPLLRSKQLRQKLFDAVPRKPGITVNSNREQVTVDLDGLELHHPLLAATALKRLQVAEQGIYLALNFNHPVLK